MDENGGNKKTFKIKYIIEKEIVQKTRRDRPQK